MAVDLFVGSGDGTGRPRLPPAVLHRSGSLEEEFLHHLEATNQGQQTDKIRGRHPAQGAKHQHRGSASEAEGQAGFLDFTPADVNDELDTADGQ